MNFHARISFERGDDPLLCNFWNEFVFVGQMHLKRCIDIRCFTQKLIGTPTVKRHRGVDARPRGREEREQTAETEAHHAYATRGARQRARHSYSDLDVPNAGVYVEGLIQGDAFFPVIR